MRPYGWSKVHGEWSQKNLKRRAREGWKRQLRRERGDDDRAAAADFEDEMWARFGDEI